MRLRSLELRGGRRQDGGAGNATRGAEGLARPPVEFVLEGPGVAHDDLQALGAGTEEDDAGGVAASVPGVADPGTMASCDEDGDGPPPRSQSGAKT